jgi:hypothetical protein
MFADVAEVFAAVFSALTILFGHHQRDCYAASVTTFNVKQPSTSIPSHHVHT